MCWRAGTLQGSADLLRGGETQVADLVEGLHLGGPGRAFGHHQRPDRFHVAVAVLGLPQLGGPPGRHGRPGWRPRCRSCLCGDALGGWGGHLHHLHPRPAQVTGQAGPVAAGALHPDPHHRAEAGQPTEQLAVTRRRGRKLLHPQQPTDPVQRRGHVHLQMGIHATRDRARGIYSCHGHPFLYLLVRGGRPPSCGGCDRPVGAGRSAALELASHHPAVVDQPLRQRRPTVGPSSPVRPHPGKSTVPATK